MFRIISTIGFLITILALLLHRWSTQSSVEKSEGNLKSILNFAQGLLRGLKKLFVLPPIDTNRDWRDWIYLLGRLSTLILVLTGFLPVLILDKPLFGLILLIHVIAAAIFVISLGVVVIIWTHNHRFAHDDWQTARIIFQQAFSQAKKSTKMNDFCKKICYWLLLPFAFVLILTILLSMYPIFGTRGQEVLIQLHGYSALVFTLTAVVYFLLRNSAVKFDSTP